MNDEESTDLTNKPVPDSMHEKTIIANGLVFEGELEAHEDILVRGRVEGQIAAEGHEVRITREAHIEGEILANRLLIEGTVSGTVTAIEKADLRQASEVRGEVHSPKLALEEGCKFNGSVEMD
jgi:cytoskeletal protein CcmA (bactofilin family)